MRENLNTFVFCLGLGLASAGLWDWFAWHVAAVFAGTIFLLAAVFPYVRMRYPK